MQFAVIDTELKPLCTRHLQPMNRVDIYWKPEGAENLSCMTGYRCVIDKCGLFYDVYSGYHERPDGTVNALDTQYHCQEHGLSMYVASHALKGAVKHFKCPQYGCSHGESVHTAAA
jgi:hypothetical protein